MPGQGHRKAHGTSAAGFALLRLAGYDAELVNTARCGMAGAFGYEKEHSEASWTAGERGLFPAVRAHPEAQVAAAGVSCRHQIEHFTGRHMLHVAEALRDAVAPQPRRDRPADGETRGCGRVPTVTGTR